MPPHIRLMLRNGDLFVFTCDDLWCCKLVKIFYGRGDTGQNISDCPTRTIQPNTSICRKSTKLPSNCREFNVFLFPSKMQHLRQYLTVVYRRRRNFFQPLCHRHGISIEKWNFQVGKSTFIPTHPQWVGGCYGTQPEGIGVQDENREFIFLTKQIKISTQQTSEWPSGLDRWLLCNIAGSNPNDAQTIELFLFYSCMDFHTLER
jgi:hypothetical protein